MSLASIQKSMFLAVTGGGLAEAAEHVKPSGLESEARLGIYAEMYWLRMRDALRADYPFVHRVLGDEDFDVLVARHLKQNASTHYSLGMLGRGFSDVVLSAQLQGLSWLADLAALEWAHAESFIAPDAPLLDRQSLASINEETFSSARLVPHSSLRLLNPAWDVVAVWRALEAGGAWQDVTPSREGTPLVVWRQGFRVFHVSVGRAEGQAMEAALLGKTLPEICEAFSAEPEPIASAFEAVGSWVTEGMMSRLELVKK